MTIAMLLYSELHTILSMTILWNDFKVLGFFHPRYRYQFSPWWDVMTRCRPEGSRNIECIDISVGLREWEFEGLVPRMMRLEDNAIAKTSKETASKTSGAGSVYCTLPRSKVQGISGDGTRLSGKAESKTLTGAA